MMHYCLIVKRAMSQQPTGWQQRKHLDPIANLRSLLHHVLEYVGPEGEQNTDSHHGDASMKSAEHARIDRIVLERYTKQALAAMDANMRNTDNVIQEEGHVSFLPGSSPGTPPSPPSLLLSSRLPDVNRIEIFGELPKLCAEKATVPGICARHGVKRRCYRREADEDTVASSLASQHITVAQIQFADQIIRAEQRLNQKGL